MITCRKTYTDIPFAHRQCDHDGHCAYIHGHNWSISITFGCEQLDAQGFVIDFGKLHFIRDWIDENLDHACLFNEHDPMKETLLQAAPQAFKVYSVKNCSCEGIAEHLYAIFNPRVQKETQERVSIVSIEVIEDSKNSATFSA